MFRRFEAKGWLLDESNQEQFLAKKIHSTEWRNRSNSSEQDGFLYEKNEDHSEDWSAPCHQLYLEKARCLLKESRLDFNGIMTVLEAVLG